MNTVLLIQPPSKELLMGLVLMSFLFVGSDQLSAQEQKNVRAFPGAEGAGAFASGGRGGERVFVTNLKDYEPGEEPIKGSLRWAINLNRPRMVLFRVSGVIELNDHLRIEQPNITVAGQTAPGAGITTKNYGTYIDTNNVILRHMRFRPGDQVGQRKVEQGADGWQTDALSITGGKNIMIDHCSASWANDEVLSVSGEEITNVTVQWSIISESLNDSTHPKGTHGYGSLIRTNGVVSFHHNLYAFHTSRSPRPGTYGDGSILLDFRNNVMHSGGKGYTSSDPVRMNFVGNHHPTTPFDATDACTYFRNGNAGEIHDGDERETPFDTPPVNTMPAGQARLAVLRQAGAVLPRRGPVDQRVVTEVYQGEKKIVNTPSEVGGWPEDALAQPPSDSDRDGIPDSWEKKHGLNPSNSEDSFRDPDNDGYSNLEEYLNGTDPSISNN